MRLPALIYLIDIILVVEFATDLKDVYPGKGITLLHSRAQLLPRFPSPMHTESEWLFPSALKPLTP